MSRYIFNIFIYFFHFSSRRVFIDNGIRISYNHIDEHNCFHAKKEGIKLIRISNIQIPGLETRKPRRLYVYTPRGYARSEQRYPVLYMFDGHNVFYDSHATYGKSWGMKEYLQKTKLPLILVAVECNPEGTRRLNEYAPWDLDIPELGRLEGQGRLTMEWFTRTLKPEIDRKYRTLPDRAHTMIAGSSMGGIMALYAAAAYSEVFSRAAALSPSLWAGGLALPALLAETRFPEPTRIWLDIGTAELPPEDHQALSALFETAAILTKSGADVAARVVPGAEHNEAAWEKRIPIFMDYLYPGA